MLQKIYILRGRRSIKGPFNLADFKKLNLQPGDRVWCKGLKDWERPEALAQLEQDWQAEQNTSVGNGLNYALG